MLSCLNNNKKERECVKTHANHETEKKVMSFKG